MPALVHNNSSVDCKRCEAHSVNCNPLSRISMHHLTCALPPHTQGTSQAVPSHHAWLSMQVLHSGFWSAVS